MLSNSLYSHGLHELLQLQERVLDLKPELAFRQLLVSFILEKVERLDETGVGLLQSFAELFGVHVARLPRPLTVL